jgi:microcystin-dependent protein
MDPFLGSIIVVGFNYAPQNWALCNGQVLPISANQALFSLFGSAFGGDGQRTFGLPNLQGRAALGMGPGYLRGDTGGEPAHTLNIQEIPGHNHFWKATSAGPSTNNPSNAVLAGTGMYTTPSNNAMSAQELGSVGGGQAHENRSPFLVLNFCVALTGIFPSRN